MRMIFKELEWFSYFLMLIHYLEMILRSAEAKLIDCETVKVCSYVQYF